MKGFYLALEGGEGAGKTTVAARLAERFGAEGWATLMVREPGGTGIGDRIRELLLDTEAMVPWAEALLFAAQRAQLAAEVIGPALAEGRLVISDRSYYSSLAYQGAGRDLGIPAVRAVNEAGLGGVVPDLVVVLAVEPEVGLARQEVVDRIGGEGGGFQQRVAAGYRVIAAAEPDRVVMVEAGTTIDSVVEEVVRLVKAHRGG
jgi:dTMP kinase